MTSQLFLNANQTSGSTIKNPNNNNSKFSLKKLSIIGVFTVVSGVISVLTLPSIYDYYIEKVDSKLSQREHLRSVNFEVVKLFSQWNMVVDISSEEKSAQFVQDNFDDYFGRYSTAKIDKLSKLNEIVHSWHMAKLYNIQADISINKNDFTEASSALSKSMEKLAYIGHEIKNIEQFNQDEVKYIGENKLASKIERTRFVTKSLQLYMTKNIDPNHKTNATNLASTYGGCEKLVKIERIVHQKMLKGLRCIE